MNARYALNAANARWGSLYDALYGTDVIPEEGGAERGGDYNPVRGDRVIAWARQFLDTHCPLADGSHADATEYTITEGVLSVRQGTGEATTLADASQFTGYTGAAQAPESILLRHNGLHIEIQIDRDHAVGKTDAAGIKDVCLESALTTIQDCEDSVAAVDAEDKVIVYRNWLGLMKGDLTDTFTKGDRALTRRLNPDRSFTGPDGSTLILPGRSLLFVRNVGHLMTNPAILNAQGEEIPEGFMDGLFTTFCALHDLKGTGSLKNSRTGSMYIVKPKMHGPDEVSLTVTLFEKIEDLFNLPRNTLKVGIMDEERRTTVNLAECIRRASERVVFINTGFPRSDWGRDSHQHGSGTRHPEERNEGGNMDSGLRGLERRRWPRLRASGRAQIGKGMWAKPDLMSEMLSPQAEHPEAGANCAWVPSPTAATLHVTHYHSISVAGCSNHWGDSSAGRSESC